MHSCRVLSRSVQEVKRVPTTRGLDQPVPHASLLLAPQDSIVTTESNQNAFSGDLDEEEILELQSQVGQA